MSDKFFFYRCTHCGEWYYSSRRIKSKKCWRCNRTFLFKNSTKFSYSCELHGAISIIKHLKQKEADVHHSDLTSV